MQGPFVDMSLIVTVGMSWYSGTPPRWNVPEDRLSPKQRQDLAKEKHYVKVFEWLQERLPFLEQVVPLMVGQAHDTFILGAFLDTHARQARATDLNSLKKCIPDYVEEALITPSLQKVAPPNNNQRKNKHWYGWHSVWTARLLVPRASRDEFDDDPQMFCDAVIGMDVKIDHEDYPSFLYSDDEEFDKDAIDVGLLRSGLLIKTVRHVLTSPSSVTKPAGKKGLGRGCISQIYKLDRVAPETIAYVATLVRNLLSSSETWEVKDGDFDGQEFYANIIKLFKGGRSVDEDWVRETLIFWNSGLVLSMAQR
ncbi:hypothetical protein BV20DRAFT_365547 [Pilatotrama ljubarskyi]|nr:hypothetical protein BV20DRAFT_365547 [Pilatotrama ljubarskyi]